MGRTCKMSVWHQSAVITVGIWVFILFLIGLCCQSTSDFCSQLNLGDDRSSNGRIIENNWANCRFEKLASSALRGWNMSMWRGERWTEKKADLNDNEQNTGLHFVSTPEDRAAYLNNQPVHVSTSHAWEKMSTIDRCILLQIFSCLRVYILSGSEKPLKRYVQTVLETLHKIKCVNLTLLCVSLRMTATESICGTLSMWFNKCDVFYIK